MSGDDTIKRRRLHEDVLERLVGMIHSRECPVGSNLPPERVQMKRFRVGRRAVREAIRRLPRMGMVEIAQGSRARITARSPRHLAEARVALETAIAERPWFLRTYIDFHVAVAAATHKSIYPAVTWVIIECWMDNQMALVHGRQPSIIAYREHERFFDMIRRPDEAGARKAMAVQLNRVIGAYPPGKKRRGCSKCAGGK